MGKPYRHDTGIRLKKKSHWLKKQEVQEAVTGGKEINDKLHALRKNFTQNLKEPVTLESIKEALNIKKEEASFFQEWDEWLKVSESDNTPESIAHKKVTKSKLLAFEKQSGEKILIKNITFGFLQKFVQYLLSTNLANNTVGGHVKKVKAFLSYLGKRDSPNVKDFRAKKEKVPIIYLEEEELQLIWEKNDLPAYLERERDFLVLRCDIGLRIGDFERLGPEHIKDNAIEMTTAKAKTITYVPLTARALFILKKYNFKPPVISLQKHNKYIKEVCRLAGINSAIEKVIYKGGKKEYEIIEKWEVISSHTAVKTFITYAVNNGIPVKTIAEIVGKDVNTIIKYYLGSTTKKSIKAHMDNAFKNKPSNENGIN